MANPNLAQSANLVKILTSRKSKVLYIIRKKILCWTKNLLTASHENVLFWRYLSSKSVDDVINIRWNFNFIKLVSSIYDLKGNFMLSKKLAYGKSWKCSALKIFQLKVCWWRHQYSLKFQLYETSKFYISFERKFYAE